MGVKLDLVSSSLRSIALPTDQRGFGGPVAVPGVTVRLEGIVGIGVVFDRDAGHGEAVDNREIGNRCIV